MRTRTLTQMLSDVRIYADIVNRTARHPDSELTRDINESIQQLREAVTRAGISYFLVVQHVTITSGAVEVPMPTTAIRVHGIDIEVQNRAVSMLPIEFEERNMFGGSFTAGNNQTGVPMFYDVVAESPAGNPNAILLFPKSNGSYQLRIWYLPAWTDLAAGADKFDGVAGWEDWVKCDVACKVAVRDKNAELYMMADRERTRAEQTMLRAAPRRKPGPTRRRDTAGERAFGETRARTFPWV